MKKILAAMLCCIMAMLTLFACAPAAEKSQEDSVKQEQNVSQGTNGDADSPQSAGVGTVAVDAAILTSETKSYVRQDAGVPASERYMFTAKVALDGTGNDYYFGLSAGGNSIPQNMDFVYASANGGELASYATLYNAEKRYDLGYRHMFTCEGNPTTGMELSVIRDGAQFYFVCDGALMQIREFDIRATVPGFAVYNCTAVFEDAVYTDDSSAIDEAIEECMAQAPNGGVGYCYSNFAGLVLDSDSVIFPDEAVQKPFEYTRTSFSGEYTGDVTVSFTTSGLKPNSAYDTSGNMWPKIALLISYENGYEDMLCIGVGKKQDRVETFLFTDFTQWHNHADFTGDISTESVIDREGDIEFRIEISDMGSFKAYRIYVNDALFALRSSKSYGPMTFGFASEYAAGQIKDFKVEPREVQA